MEDSTVANTISNSFIEQWSADVKHAFQQRDQRLRRAVRVVNNVRGDTYNFNKLGAVAANTKARNGDLTYIEPQHSVVQASLTDQYAPIPIDKLDMPKVQANSDMRREYVEAGSAAIARSMDDLIVTAIDASNTEIATTTGAFTFAKFLEAQELLNGIDSDGERFLFVGARQVRDALNITNLTSADYAALSSVNNGKIASALGFTWIMSNRLPEDTGTRTCFAVDKSAIGLAIGYDISTEINYVPHQALYLVTTMMSAGAAVIDPLGVVSIPCSEA
jgi:hypothetical protein